VRDRRWTESIGVALALVLLFGSGVWLARYGIDVTDEGYFLDLASRVQDGQLPYRDFDTYYTPGLFYELRALARIRANIFYSHLLGSSAVPR
jgi:hypothetical protein